MPYVNTEHKYAYYPVAKCANTSIKTMIGVCEGLAPEFQGETRKSGQGLQTVDGECWFVHRAMKNMIRGGYKFSKLKEKDSDAYFKFAVVREPVSRLSSAYVNKVLEQKHLNRKDVPAKLEALGVPQQPTLAEFVEHLEAYRSVNDTIRKHTEPLSFSLGTDPSYFDRIYRMSEVGEVRLFLEKVYGRSIDDFEINRSKPGTTRVTDETVVSMIRDAFQEDYELFGDCFD